MGSIGKRIAANGLSFNVVDEGEGSPVLLLHGFPDSSHLWRHQVPALVSAGFRAIAPDLRGFGESDRPAETESYGLPLILADVTGILDALGIERAQVVGHDWGAAVAWMLASFFPARVERLAALAVGHPDGYARVPIEQREKSWYMLLFQFEEVAERALSQQDWHLFRQWTRNHPECERWIADLSRPGALRAGLNWYRANVTPENLFAEQVTSAAAMQTSMVPHVQCPTLGIWSSGEAYLVESMMTGSADFVDGPWRYERVEGASHWIPLDQPARLNSLLTEFLVPARSGSAKGLGR